MKALPLVALLLMTGCTTHVKRTDTFDLDVVKQHIHEANQVFGERFKNNDPAWYAERYTVDACALPDQEPTVCGLDAIRAFYYNDGVNAEIVIVVTETAVYGTGDAVIEEGTFDFPDDKGGSYSSGKFIAIWKQENNRWKLYREIWNDNAASL